MRIIFLGTNGWYSDEKGNTPCILIDSKNHYVVLDAGNGMYKLDQYITEQKPISLFISHFHLDHVSGLHILGKFTFSQGIDIYVGAGRKKDFETLVHPPFTIGYTPNPQNINNLRTEIRLHELKDGMNSLPFPIEVITQFHAYIDHGYRITLENKIIAYSGDCGISNTSNTLAHNADLLIHECSWNKPKDVEMWGHVDATQAATLAEKAGVKKLILTHFDPTEFKTLVDRKQAEQKARNIFKETTIAYDDMIVSV